jgi:hypothetical protein
MSNSSHIKKHNRSIPVEGFERLCLLVAGVRLELTTFGL